MRNALCVCRGQRILPQAAAGLPLCAQASTAAAQQLPRHHAQSTSNAGCDGCRCTAHELAALLAIGPKFASLRHFVKPRDAVCRASRVVLCWSECCRFIVGQSASQASGCVGWRLSISAHRLRLPPCLP